MKTKTITKKKNENDTVIISVNTLQEAKEKIHSDIQNGINYRDIVKTKFDIKGTIKSFNISQINQIKAEFEPKIEEKRTDHDKAKVFKLFQKGYSPTDVIIKTNLNFEFVKDSWEQFAEINGKKLVPKLFFEKLDSILVRGGWGGGSLKGILGTVDEVVTYAQELDKFTYHCCRCGKEMFISDKTLKDAQNYLSKKWGHAECVNN